MTLLLDLWNQWEIQILVALSFVLQVFLLLFGGIRRRNASFAVRVFLWFVYLLADATAIYTLGHMASSGRRSGLQHLVAFWAPFLVLHLGGQDTFTAYSLEDNELWLRHLLSLGVQSFGAAYLLYKYIAGARLLIPASILVLVTGILKYGERIWALKCATMSGMQASVVDLDSALSTAFGALPVLLEEPTKCDSFESYANNVIQAGSMLHFSKRFLVAPRTAPEWRSPGDYLNRGAPELFFVDLRYSGPLWIPAKRIFELIDLELSLMYDLLYTKSAVVHTWYGYSIRAFSFFAIVAATILFIFSRGENGYGIADVAVTYVLLIGAFVLEFTSIFRVIVSACRKRWVRFNKGVLFLRWQVRIWLGRGFHSIGHYNLISMSASPRIDIRWMIAKLIGLEDWWNKVHHSKSIPASPAVVEAVYTEIKTRAELTEDEAMELDKSIGFGMWIRKRSSFDGLLREFIRKEINKMELTDCIMSFHIATDIFFHCCDENKKTAGDLPEVVMALSNYMMYLLRMHPDILPRPTTTGTTTWNKDMYDETFNKLIPQLFNFRKVNQDRGHRPQDILLAMMKSDISVHETEDIFKSKEAKKLQGRYKKSVFFQGSQLAAELLEMEINLWRKFKFLSDLWVDTLIYVADGVTANFHAKQLSSGGEFLTVVSVLMAHFGLQKDVLGRCKAKGDDACAGDNSQNHQLDNNSREEISEEPGVGIV